MCDDVIFITRIKTRVNTILTDILQMNPGTETVQVASDNPSVFCLIWMH